MKVVVVPDIHNKIQLADAILKKEGDADKVILLGDIWDHFNDTAEDARAVARWVRDLITDNRLVFLWGNHDIGYGFQSKRVLCSGYDLSKELAIWEVLDESHFRRWKFFWQCQGFLLTHAGLHPNFLPPMWKEKDITSGNIRKFLTRESAKCAIELSQQAGFHWFALAGDARRVFKSGLGPGGLLWCDAREEFEPIPRLSQIFGHTPFKDYPMIIQGDSWLNRMNSAECLKITVEAKDHWNVALDCHLKYYGVIEDGCLLIKRSPLI